METTVAQNRSEQIWSVQIRRETHARALANAIHAAIVLAEHSNSPDVGDLLLPIHQLAIRRVQAIEAHATA